MKRIEKFIHAIVEPYPFLRVPVVAVYQRICSIVPTDDYEVSDFIARPGYFFGFHDKCPWSVDNTKILAHNFDINKPLGQVEKGPVAIGYFEDSSLKNFRPLGFTHAWNWQQGSMLQWLGNTDHIIYNDTDLGCKIAQIIDLNGTTVAIIPYHIVATSPDGKLALSYSYERLGAGMKGYGYYTFGKAKACGNDNLSIVNLESGVKIDLFNHGDFISRSNSKAERKSHNSFYYCRFSPSGQRFSFYYRRALLTGEVKTYLYSSDITGRDLFMFPGDRFTHMTWLDDWTVLAYFKPPDKKAGFYLVKDRDGSAQNVGQEYLASDGHPQFSNDKRYILVDTYPDRFRNQYLKIFDTKVNSQTILLKKRIPFNYRYERRCDYHPRYDRKDTMVCFDCAHTNVRPLCIMKLPPTVLQKPS